MKALTIACLGALLFASNAQILRQTHAQEADTASQTSVASGLGGSAFQSAHSSKFATADSVTAAGGVAPIGRVAAPIARAGLGLGAVGAVAPLGLGEGYLGAAYPGYGAAYPEYGAAYPEYYGAAAYPGYLGAEYPGYYGAAYPGYYGAGYPGHYGGLGGYGRYGDRFGHGHNFGHNLGNNRFGDRLGDRLGGNLNRGRNAGGLGRVAGADRFRPHH